MLAADESIAEEDERIDIGIFLFSMKETRRPSPYGPVPTVALSKGERTHAQQETYASLTDRR